jgi:hypothetical protein
VCVCGSGEVQDRLTEPIYVITARLALRRRNLCIFQGLLPYLLLLNGFVTQSLLDIAPISGVLVRRCETPLQA